MVSVLTRVEDYLHSEIKRGMIKERRERGPTAPGGVWELGGRGVGCGESQRGAGGSLREQWRNNVQIAVSDARNATQVSLCGHHALDWYRQRTYIFDVQRHTLRTQTFTFKMGFRYV